MRSVERVVSKPLVELEASSRSLRVCSSSIFCEMALVRSMYSLNCCRLSKGPRLKLQRIGRTSKARKSVSAIWPTCLKTARAAIMTVGSFVLIALRRGTIFSWTVYLSRMALLLVMDFEVEERMVEGGLPPQRITKASRPRTLMARLLVLLKMVATRGKSSFLMVEKSRTGRMMGSMLRDLSTREWVGDSRARRMMGRISVDCQHSSSNRTGTATNHL